MRIGLVGSCFFGSEAPFHQTFLCSGQAGRAIFTNDPDEQCDYIVTFGVLPDDVPTWWRHYPLSRRVAVLHENPLIFFPSDAYLEEHGVLLSPFLPRRINGPNWIPTQTGVPWFYGAKYKTNKGLSHEREIVEATRLDELVSKELPQKNKHVSFITSTKSGLPGYNFRLALANGLKKRLGSTIDIFGFGHNPVALKDSALDPYHYTIVIENSFVGNYWTEKLSDAYLGFSTPIYLGAPNVQSYFDFPVLQIDSSSISHAVEQIAKIIDKEPDPLALICNRNKIMFKHNVFYLLEDVLWRL